MASKIQSHNFYVAITPYKVQGVEDQYNELSVFTDYNNYTHQFYVSLHAGWKSTFGHGSMIMGDSNPLTASTRVNVKDSPKNSQKTINEMGAALELAKADIAWLFDERMWPELQQFVKDVALSGYNAMLEERIRSYKNERTVTAQVNAGRNNSNNQQTSEDETMATKNNNESKRSAQNDACQNKNVQNDAQVSNQTSEASEVDVTVNEMSIDDIKPKIIQQAMVQTAQGGPATTMPLGKHGSIVIAGVGGTEDDGGSKTADVPQPADIKPQTSTKVQDSVAAASSPLSTLHSKLSLVVYTTKRGEQAPRIEGFGGETDDRWRRHYDEKMRLKEAAKEADKKNEKLRKAMKGKSKEQRELLMKKWVSVPTDPFNAGYFTDRTTGEKYYNMVMGARYMSAARDLVDAYNSGDETAIAQAEQAVMDVRTAIVSDYKAQRAAREAERNAKNTETTEKTESTEAEGTENSAMSAQEQQMFELFKKFIAGDKDAMAQVAAAAAKAA